MYTPFSFATLIPCVCRRLLSYIIGTGILHLIIFLINDKSRTEAMDNVIHVWTIVIIIDLIICISYFVWPPKNTESKL